MKKGLSVFIADDNMEIVRRIEQELAKNALYQIMGHATNGEDCIKELSNRNLDILILDLIMPMKDGIQVLKELKKNRINVEHIICTTPFINDTMMHELNSERIDYLIMKPFEIFQLCDKLNYIIGMNKMYVSQGINIDMNDEGNLHMFKLQLESDVSSLLREIGIPANINGFKYLRTAIMEAYDHEEYIVNITKGLYPDIARRYLTTASRVERSMRHAIEVAWLRGNSDVLNDIFAYTISAAKAKPTNSEFIAIISDKLRLDNKIKNSHKFIEMARVH